MSVDYPPWQERLVTAVERIADGIERIEDRMAAERLARVTAARQEAEQRPPNVPPSEWYALRQCATCRLIDAHEDDCPNRPNRPISEAAYPARCVWCRRSWRICVKDPCDGRREDKR